ncbi:fungal-specific transcription factor domain-containing protein [Aspergillus granulosus]|uniref:Fungal-specific transcription factor domain-containing protein n=1 Tax=Aspergillus granulosus TaxID=176169 RepID=A0ABR4HZM5_9EURO
MVQYFGRACRTCRRRGRGCDRRLPFCQTCEKKGLTCEGYPIRWSGIASRGKFANKDAPILSPSVGSTFRAETKRRTSRPQSESVPDTLQGVSQPGEELEASYGGGVLLDEDSIASFVPSDDLTDIWLNPNAGFQFVEIPSCESRVEDSLLSPSFQYGLNNLPVPDEVKFFLRYYITDVAPKLCVDNLCTDNPYTQYILPLAIEVRSLLYACAALAVCQYTIRYPGLLAGNEFWKFKGKAMKRLQEDLYSESRAKHPATLATVMMLCLCEICHGGYSDFEAHFRGSKRLTELRGPDRTPNGFVEQYLAWLDIMAAASHPRLPIFDISDISLPSTGQTKELSQWSFDVFPCPLDQFECIFQIISLYKSQPDPANPSPEILSQVASIKATILTRPIHSERGMPWLHLTEAYRFGITLYLLRLFCCTPDEDEIGWLVSSVIYHAKNTPPASGWSDQLLWPLFHAGLEVRDSRRQAWLSEKMGCMRISGGFGNVDSALGILRRVWSENEPINYLKLMAGNGTGSMLLI